MEVLPKLTAIDRIISVIDNDTEFSALYNELSPDNILDIPGYTEKILSIQETTGLKDSIVTGIGVIDGVTCAIGAMDYRFMLGSMGRVAGEKISNLIEKSGTCRYPLVIFCCSGGARVQEGIYSLMQMGKIATTLAKWKSEIPLFISVLTDPTMGGVTASIGMLGDIVLAEPNAQIGFAGPRIIESVINTPLPENFQSSENQLKNGLIDAVVDRSDMKKILGKLLNSVKYQVIPESKSTIKFNITNTQKDIWQKIKDIRTFDRLDSKDYISEIFTDFIELHGDRVSGDDGAIYGGIAYFRNIPVTVIGITKGHNTQDLVESNFGMVSPSGYRKAIRLMKLSPTRPIILFVNTPGAYPGKSAEIGGQGHAIANCLFEMANITAPTLSFITGEGGSGGALALAVSNSVWMLENSVYSVISPEGFASILFKDSKKAPEAAYLMKMSTQDLLAAQVIDGIIPEYGGATKEHLLEISKNISEVINNFLMRTHNMSGLSIVENKLQRFNKF